MYYWLFSSLCKNKYFDRKSPHFSNFQTLPNRYIHLNNFTKFISSLFSTENHRISRIFRLCQIATFTWITLRRLFPEIENFPHWIIYFSRCHFKYFQAYRIIIISPGITPRQGSSNLTKSEAQLSAWIEYHDELRSSLKCQSNTVVVVVHPVSVYITNSDCFVLPQVDFKNGTE